MPYLCGLWRFANA